MREATFVNDPEYYKLKTHANTTPTMSTSNHHLKLTAAEQELIEREKDRRFQILFNEAEYSLAF